MKQQTASKLDWKPNNTNNKTTTTISTQEKIEQLKQ
jgi:hypothetical protein